MIHLFWFLIFLPIVGLDLLFFIESEVMCKYSLPILVSADRGAGVIFSLHLADAGPRARELINKITVLQNNIVEED